MPVGECHLAEHVFRRLGCARILEDVRRLAGPPCPLEHHRQIELYAGIRGRRLRERLECEIATSYSPRRADSTAASRVCAATLPRLATSSIVATPYTIALTSTSMTRVDSSPTS